MQQFLHDERFDLKKKNMTYWCCFSFRQLCQIWLKFIKWRTLTLNFKTSFFLLPSPKMKTILQNKCYKNLLEIFVFVEVFVFVFENGYTFWIRKKKRTKWIYHSITQLKQNLLVILTLTNCLFWVHFHMEVVNAALPPKL